MNFTKLFFWIRVLWITVGGLLIYAVAALVVRAYKNFRAANFNSIEKEQTK